MNHDKTSHPPARRRRDLLLAGAVFLAAIAVYALLLATREQPAPLAPEEQAWRVTVEPLLYGSFAPSLLLYGQLESPSSAELGAKLAADVVELRVLEGDRVEKGQLLLRLDDADVQIQARGDESALAHERELLELARKDHARSQQLLKEGLASAADVDAARQVVEQRALAVAGREQSLAAARLALARTRITAPFAGRVTRVAVAVGDRVQPGQTLLGLYDPERVELRAPLPQPYLPRIQAALAAAGELPASVEGEPPVAARLVRIAAAARSGSANVDGFFRFAGAHPAWEPGRSLAITLSLPALEDVAAIPYEALYGRQRVYLAQAGRLKGVAVETLGEYREPGQKPRLLVRAAGLQPGLPLVVTQVPRAVDGLKVTVPDATPAAPPAGKPE